MNLLDAQAVDKLGLISRKCITGIITAVNLTTLSPTLPSANPPHRAARIMHVVGVLARAVHRDLVGLLVDLCIKPAAARPTAEACSDARAFAALRGHCTCRLSAV